MKPQISVCSAGSNKKPPNKATNTSKTKTNNRKGFVVDGSMKTCLLTYIQWFLRGNGSCQVKCQERGNLMGRQVTAYCSVSCGTERKYSLCPHYPVRGSGPAKILSGLYNNLQVTRLLMKNEP